MEISKVIKQHRKLCRFVSEKKIKQSLDILAEMIDSASAGDLHDDYNNIVMTYRNMLSYTIDGINDPERNKIYLKLIQSILSLSDRVRQDILSHFSGWHTYWVKQQTEKELRITGKTIVETVDDLMFKSDLDEWLKLSQEINPDPESEISKRHKLLIKNIFNHLWLTDYYGDAEFSLINIILKSGKFRWHEASLFTSAITLSTLRTWQIEKLMYLLDIYEDGQEQIMERALSGVILNLHYYNPRVKLYPEIEKRITNMSRNSTFREHCKIIVLQTIRSRETEMLARKLHDEIPDWTEYY